MFKNDFQINPDIPLLHTKVEKDYMHDLMVKSSEKKVNTMMKKQMKLNKACWSEIKTFLRRWKMLEVRYLSDAVNAAASSSAKNTIKLRY